MEASPLRPRLAVAPRKRFRPAAFVGDWLTAEGIPHRIEVLTALAQSIPAARAALMRTGAGWRLAIVPASRRLDPGRARISAGRLLRRASAEEVAMLFPEFPPDAVPVIGPHYPTPELLDWRLLRHEEIRSPAGDGEHVLILGPEAIVAACGPLVADLSEG